MKILEAIGLASSVDVEQEILEAMVDGWVDPDAQVTACEGCMGHCGCCERELPEDHPIIWDHEFRIGTGLCHDCWNAGVRLELAEDLR